MKTLIVGAGALGGLIAARMIGVGENVWLATRDDASATTLRARGLSVRGVGGDVRVAVENVAALSVYETETWDLVVLATKAHDAIDVAPRLRGRVLPIQNGGVAEILASMLGEDRVVGALSNLGATMHVPGVYEQRNAGHILVDARGADVAEWLARGVTVRTTTNFRGAVWSKLLLNCAVTTIGAVVGEPMRAFVARPEGFAAFQAAYTEALAVARAMGARPERMLVEPIPPEADHRAWVDTVLAAYGDLKASMLQDFERGKRTEVDFINGYVVELGKKLGVPTPVNAQIVDIVHAIERGARRPSRENLAFIAK